MRLKHVKIPIPADVGILNAGITVEQKNAVILIRFFLSNFNLRCDCSVNCMKLLLKEKIQKRMREFWNYRAQFIIKYSLHTTQAKLSKHKINHLVNHSQSTFTITFINQHKVNHSPKFDLKLSCFNLVSQYTV